jgi:hypothetical protein
MSRVREANGHWKPGVSGNPGGMPKLRPDYRRRRELCRQHSEQAALGMIDLAQHATHERVRYMALQWLYEQAWGKAREYNPREDAPPAVDLLELTSRQRD